MRITPEDEEGHMDFQSLQSIWTGEAGNGGNRSGESEEALIRAVLRRDRALDRRVRIRDFVELGTAAAMSFGFAVVAFRVPTPWPWLGAALLTLGVGAIFVRERRRRPGAEPAGRLRERLGAALEEADHQIRLLRSVFWWYLLPLAGAALLVVAGTVWDVAGQMDASVRERGGGGLAAAVVTVATLFVAGVFGCVWWLNQLAVRRHLLPHRQEIAALVDQLDAADEERQETAVVGSTAKVDG
jgi:hypothetical protein